jgi:hypothetical protein
MNNRYSNKEVILFLKEIEAQFPVDKWTVFNIHIWPILRNSFCFFILQSNKTISSGVKKNQRIKFFQKITLTIKVCLSFGRMIIHFLTTKKSDTLFLSDGVSKFKLNNIYYDKFCDPMCHLKNLSPEKTIFFSQNPFSVPDLRKRYFSLSGIEQFAYVISKVLLALRCYSFYLPSYEKFYVFLQERKLDKNLSQKELIQKALIVNLISWFFYVYIKFKRIKACYSVCYYGYLGYGLALASKKLGIPLYDIQHGGIENCPAYHQWFRIPDHGYEIIPSHFLLWDESTSYVFKTENSINFLNSCTYERFGFPLLCSPTFYEEIKNQGAIIREKFRKFEKIIFIPLQPQFFGRSDWDRLASEIVLFQNETWLWWIRSHPAYKDEYGLEHIKNLNLQNVYYDHGDYSIYSILSICSCTVTTASSSIIESAYFNVPALIISATGIEDFDSYIKSGKAHSVPEDQSIVDTIKKVISS